MVHLHEKIRGISPVVGGSHRYDLGGFLMSKITVTISGETGSGKSAIAGEIEIAMKAIGVPVQWKNADREWWEKGNEYWIDLYKPEVTIVEQNLVNGELPRKLTGPGV